MCVFGPCIDLCDLSDSKMDTVMNKLKEEMERYTYLLEDTEKTMKEYENDIDVTLNQLQILENKIKVG